MKRILALILSLLMVVAVFCSCGGKTTEEDEKPQGTPSAEEEGTPSAPTLEPAISEDQVTSSSEATEEQDELAYGVYYLTTKSGQKFALRSGNLKINSDRELDARFTIHKKTVDGETYYGIYMGDDENRAMAFDAKLGKIYAGQEKYALTDRSLWQITFENGYARIKNKLGDSYLTLKDGKAFFADLDPENEGQLFNIEKAAKSDRFDEYVSKKGNIVIRVDYELTGTKRNYLDKEFMQLFADHFQEAYEAEIALTGYVPYVVIVIDGWQDRNIVAGVVDNYNVIVVDKGFMATEMKLMPLRLKMLNMYDMSFALLHEMGHMFDSQRAWNFESEAWTDLKLCYVVYKMTEDHKKTDGFVYGCAPADYRGTKECFTYETLADCLNIHAHKGAMVTVYGFYGAAREFLLMTYDFGWEPFMKTFHWFQDNGKTQSDYERLDRFTTFVDKLSEYAGVDVKEKYLKKSWQVFIDFYSGKTNEAV